MLRKIQPRNRIESRTYTVISDHSSCKREERHQLVHIHIISEQSFVPVSKVLPLPPLVAMVRMEYEDVRTEWCVSHVRVAHVHSVRTDTIRTW